MVEEVGYKQWSLSLLLMMMLFKNSMRLTTESCGSTQLLEFTAPKVVRTCVGGSRYPGAGAIAAECEREREHPAPGSLDLHPLRSATAIEHKAALASLFSSLSRLLRSFIRSFALALVLLRSRTVRLAVPWICWTFQPTLLAVLVKASCEWSSVFRARWFCSIIERDVASGRSGRAPQPHSDRVVG